MMCWGDARSPKTISHLAKSVTVRACSKVHPSAVTVICRTSVMGYIPCVGGINLPVIVLTPLFGTLILGGEYVQPFK